MILPIVSVSLAQTNIHAWIVAQLLKQLPPGSRYMRYFLGKYQFVVPGYPESNAGCPSCAKTKVVATFSDGAISIDLPKLESLEP